MKKQQDRDIPANLFTATRVVLGIGVLLIAFGIAYQAATSTGDRRPSTLDQIVSGIAAAVGGGALGAGINTIVVQKYEQDVLKEIQAVVAESVRARFTSDHDELNMFRRDWHHYYLTQAGGKVGWWYQTYNFSKSVAIGSITEETSVLDSDGSSHAYLTEAGVRGQRFILFETRQGGSEASVIEIYPTPRGFQTVHTAITFLQSWDSTNLVTKSILSRRPLIDGIVGGRVSDVHANTLDEVWRNDFLSQNKVLIEDTSHSERE